MIKNGTRLASQVCDTQVIVVRSADSPVSVALNAPYRLRQGDSWVVTKQLPGAHEAGAIVLKPLT